MEEKKYELIKFNDGDFSLDVTVSPNDETMWLRPEDMALLFDVNRPAIVKHISNILSDGELEGSTCSILEQVQREGNRIIKRKIKYYNLDMIISVGYRVNSRRGILFQKWALEIINNIKAKKAYAAPLIVFEHNGISLDVNVSPDEDTVWLTKDQITILYSTTRQNIEYHINNIYAENELEARATCKEILQVQIENNRKVTRTVNMYNLDMIISLGYRINSKKGIIFRKWATQVLKQYLLNGYSINEDRCIVCHNSVLQIENKLNEIQTKIHDIEETIYQENEKLLYEGEIVDAYIFIRKLFFLAKKEITIIDPYADKFLLSMLTDIKVTITIITSSSSYLNNIDLQDNISIMKNDIIHDRFIIIDEVVYMIGTSINEIGKKRFVIIKTSNLTKNKILE